MKNIYLFVIVVIALAASGMLAGCNSPESVIKKDLNTRFTKFEIVEIKKDSANVYDAANLLNELQVDIATGNASMAGIENRYFDKELTHDQTCKYMDSITKELFRKCDDFMKLQFSRKEPCFFVKYRIFKDERKIEKEEYYHLRTFGDNKTDIIHRPVDWDEYLQDEGHPDLLGESMKYYLGFLRDLIN